MLTPSGVRQTIFGPSAGNSLIKSFSADTPLRPGPRNCGQSAAINVTPNVIDSPVTATTVRDCNRITSHRWRAFVIIGLILRLACFQSRQVAANA
jgi:hypothetical protein